MINHSVGQGGFNDPAEVHFVKNRFIQLGYTWLSADSTVNRSFIETIRLFQSIISSSQTIKGDGRIDPGYSTLKWLTAENAPRWMKLPVGSKTNKTEGYYNFTGCEQHDGNDHGTSWLVEHIQKGAKIYSDSWISNHPGASVMWINDMSDSDGGDHKDHLGHECGLSFDLRLPRKDGLSGGIEVSHESYDRNAMREIIKAMRFPGSLIGKIFLNDPDLIREGLTRTAKGHENHAHIQIDFAPQMMQ
ncbi:MAG: hypothetical protein ACHQFW_03590 [Chitinophagales bacterium]